MVFRNFFINRLVKSAKGFSPGQKIIGSMTVYDGSMTLLAMILIKHAREFGDIDQRRMSVLERVHGHFNEHIMFRQAPPEIARGVLFDMNGDYDNRFDSHGFEREYEKESVEIGRKLPTVVKKELLAHLAMFQRVDVLKVDNAQRETSIRDAHGLLFGNVTPKDISEILSVASGYIIEERQ